MNIDAFFSSQFWTAAKISTHRMSLQSDCGIGFDKEAAEALLVRITREMGEIEQEIEPQLPSRPLNKGELDAWRFPAKPFKADGTHSSVFFKWLAKTGATLVDEMNAELDGVTYPIVGGQPTKTTGPMELSDQSAYLKDYLRSLGWKPTLWNFKTDARKKPVRDERGNYIKLSPKFHEKGVLCPHLLSLDLDISKPIVKWMSLKHRRGVLKGVEDDKGWLNNERLAWDGRLSAGAAGITNTFRKRHTVCTNIPKAEEGVLYGKEMRGLFVASRPGYVLVGTDASGLEARVEAHYTKPYPGGEAYAAELLEGDVHLNTVASAFVDKVGHLIGTDDWHKEHPLIKPLRHTAKTLKYATMYGASPAKIASTLNCPLSEAKEMYDAFWDSAPVLKHLRSRLELHWETVGRKKRIKTIDGRWVGTRSKHSLINALFQSTGAISVDYAAMFYDKEMGGPTIDNEGYPCYRYQDRFVYRVAEMHDEWVDEVPEELAQEIGEKRVRSIQRAGRFLKLNVELTGEYHIGNSWAEIH